MADMQSASPLLALCSRTDPSEVTHKREPNKVGLVTSEVFTLELGGPRFGSQEEDGFAGVQRSWIKAEY